VYIQLKVTPPKQHPRKTIFWSGVHVEIMTGPLWSDARSSSTTKITLLLRKYHYVANMLIQT